MHEPVHLVLGKRERVAADWLLSNRAIDQVICLVLHDIHNDRAFSEADIFIAHRRGAIAPSTIAAKGTAHQSGINGWVHALNRHIAAPHRDVKVDEQIRVLRIFDLLQPLFSQIPLDSGLYFTAYDVAVSIIVTRDGFTAFTARYYVARYDWARPSPAGLFFGGPPCPCGVASNVRVAVSRNVHVFVASGEQNGAGKGAGGKQRAPRLHKHLI